MNDDFTADDQQPEEIRDREIPGRTPRARHPRREAAPRSFEGEPRKKVEMPDSAKPARALLAEILGKMGMSHVEVEYIPRSEGEYFEITGPDLAMLIGRHGNTLEALNLLFNNILNVGVRSNRQYFTIDAEGYRARRADQLKNLALSTLERCIREKKPVRLEPMLPSERKIVHMALTGNQYVRTESEGVEPERCLVVFPI
ncbi:MAG: R3H domain-containing nucleic acid-binding protein [Candidatus Baltobacteraceae bacterium]